ncbi:MAG: IS1/IS6 family transposase [Chloroflexi bacterium]|nr:IS1/IS6 family transposase [Chloroflexota bacterium]
MNCKYCKSTNIVKFGTYTNDDGKEIQRYYCKDCKHKFTELDTLPKMKTPINEIGSALNMYYGGMPIDAIQGHLKQSTGKYLSEPAIYKWIIRFTREAIVKAKDFKPQVGNTWLADETGINVGGHNVWFWDIIDAKTRYLLASHISLARTTEDAQILVEKATQRAGKMPEVIITDKLRQYIDGIDLATGGRARHVRSKPFTDENSTNIIERFHGTLKQRTNVIRHFKDLETARLLTEGWLIHYNFFKEHESLGNVSPAKYMKIDMPFKDWNDVVRYANVRQPSTFEFAGATPIHEPITEKQKRSAYFRKAVQKSRVKKRLVELSQPQLRMTR